MKCSPTLILLAFPLLINACGSLAMAPSVTKSEDQKTLTIVGDEAELFISALFQSGVRDPSGRLGALKLQAEVVSCSAPVVPAPIPSCTLMLQGELKVVPTTPAATLYQVLRAHGASRPTDLLGVNLVGASDIACERNTTVSGVSRCTMSVGASD
ncbi:MAG: hypothetical protein FJ146_09165 [Deltaproteobacteria bacterium]|nr:hypothetical protein [Deltaproteobacteria bacterium]